MKSIGNVLLATTLLIATTGVTLSKHYCLGRLKSVSVFEQAKGCPGSERDAPLPCCDYVDTELKVEDLTISSFDYNGETDYYFLAVFSWIVTDETGKVHSRAPRFQIYDPPPNELDKQTQFQVFLI